VWLKVEWEYKIWNKFWDARVNELVWERNLKMEKYREYDKECGEKIYE